MMITFEWDKNQANIKKHGISFERAKAIFENPTASWVDDRQEYNEMREISLGIIDDAVVIAVVHTDRKDNIRIISARLANKEERKKYDDATKR